ncbi:MAG TPA: hypothetical protein VMR48_02485 [Gaiellaceae bacterium]|nr:hypothetical protein [Gaiellaceae bacterium]
MSRDEKDPPEPVGWEGDWRLAFPERYLKHQHLRGRDVTLTISRVQLPVLDMVLPGTRPKRERKLIISFKELEGRSDVPNIWIAGKRSCRMIEALYGRRPPDWVGKRITLYADPDVTDSKGVKVGGIRVRSKVVERDQRAPGGAPTSPPPPAREPSAPAGPSPMTSEEMEEIARQEREEGERA